MSDRYENQIVLSFASPLGATSALTLALSLISACGFTAYLSVI